MPNVALLAALFQSVASRFDDLFPRPTGLSNYGHAGRHPYFPQV